MSTKSILASTISGAAYVLGSPAISMDSSKTKVDLSEIIYTGDQTIKAIIVTTGDTDLQDATGPLDNEWTFVPNALPVRIPAKISKIYAKHTGAAPTSGSLIVNSMGSGL